MIWIIICLKHISYPARKCVHDFIYHAWSAFKLLVDFSFTLYHRKSLLKISSGNNFDRDWPIFENLLFEYLSKLDLKSSLEQDIGKSSSKMIQFKLLSGLNDLILTFNRAHRSKLLFFYSLMPRPRSLTLQKTLVQKTFLTYLGME